MRRLDPTAEDVRFGDETEAGLHLFQMPFPQAKPGRIAPGLAFFSSHGAVAEIVERIGPHGRLISLEGNPDDGGALAGIGLFPRQRRALASVNPRFLNRA